MPEIVVVDLSNVTVDGVQAGSVTDILMNYGGVPGIRGALLEALMAWKNACQSEHLDHCQSLCKAHASALSEKDAAASAALAEQAAKHVEALAAKDAEVATAIANLTTSHETAIERLKSEYLQLAKDTQGKHMEELNAVRAHCKSQATQIQALGGTELGQRLAREAECAKARELMAAAQAILDAHGAES
jgi:hypothetical protein